MSPSFFCKLFVDFVLENLYCIFPLNGLGSFVINALFNNLFDDFFMINLNMEIINSPGPI
jgi:hypothetical protein